jgi:hypothetical protein
MVGVNEYFRPNKKVRDYDMEGNLSLNFPPEKCSWQCHEDTNHCKENHVKYAGEYFEFIDPIYFGIINSLKSTGDYGLANIIFLVILFPLFMYFLLIRSIDMEFKIRELKKSRNGAAN